MEQKTKIHAEDGKQEILITREFDLPVELLFKAHAEADIFEQWMSHDYGIVKTLQFECRKQGSWSFQTSDAKGSVVFQANGVFHEVIHNRQIVRTFEMENSPFDVQLEFLDFEELDDNSGNQRSKLSIQSIYKSVVLRNEMLKLPFGHGLNMAHNRLQDVLGKLNRVSSKK